MRSLRLWTACCAVVLLVGSVVPADAQTGFRSVSDAKGLFSISLPADWQVANNEVTDAVFDGVRRSPLASHVLSTLAAHSVGDLDTLAILAVIALDLPHHVPASEFAGIARSAFPPEWTITQDGRATIAGRDAYYVYYTMKEHGMGLYMVMSYFPIGRAGFLVVGGTLNEPAAIQRNFATISRMLETFRTSPALGAAPSY